MISTNFRDPVSMDCSCRDAILRIYCHLDLSVICLQRYGHSCAPFTLLSQNIRHSGQSGLAVCRPLLRALNLRTGLGSDSKCGRGKFLPGYDRLPRDTSVRFGDSRPVSILPYTAAWGCHVGVKFNKDLQVDRWTRKMGLMPSFHGESVC
jgi:hypothetical protein